jgi:hypothetical protein
VSDLAIHVRVRFINEWTGEKDDRQWTVRAIAVSSDGVLHLEFPDDANVVLAPRHKWVLTYPNPLTGEDSHA